MSQNYKTQTKEDYIDEGIFVLQDRDDAVVTVFAGKNAPKNPFQDLIWNDVINKVLMRYNNGSWEPLLNYGKNYVSIEELKKEYQPLNEKLTNYSRIEVKDLGFANTRFIPMSYFYLNNFFPDAKKSLSLGKLGYKNRINNADIENKSINKKQLNPNIITEPAFQIGDIIPSFNNGTKNRCVKLSTSSSITYTAGALASNSTYKGDVYKNLYKFVWQKLNTTIYSSLGVITNKGTSWDRDWSGNKRLALPSPEVRVIVNVTPSTASISWKSDFRSGTTNVITGHIGDKITLTITRDCYVPAKATFILIEDLKVQISLLDLDNSPRSDYNERGNFISAKCTLATNESKTDYLYTWSLRFSNAVIPVIVDYNGIAPRILDWNMLEYLENSVMDKINGGVYDKTTKKWINAIAANKDKYMLWCNSNGRAKDTLLYSTATMWGWPNNSVYTNDFSFTVNGNDLDVYKKGNFFYKFKNIIYAITDVSSSFVIPNQDTILSLKQNITYFMKY